MADDENWRIVTNETTEKVLNRTPDDETFANFLGTKVYNQYQVGLMIST